MTRLNSSSVAATTGSILIIFQIVQGQKNGIVNQFNTRLHLLLRVVEEVLTSSTSVKASMQQFKTAAFQLKYY